jgi:carboxylate-amine ligase
MTVEPDILRARFDAEAPLTVGVEEELFVVDPATLDLVPQARSVLDALGGDARFTLELPAAQLEIVLPPCRNAGEAVEALRAARSRLLEVDGVAFLAAGVHPFTAPLGVLNTGGRYDDIAQRYGAVARAQLVSALQVHVRVSGAERTLAVYNALRSYLPLVAAIAGNAPFHGGIDTGLASVRPEIGGLLPRQGVPPRLASWRDYVGALARLEDPGQWWWEVRPHLAHGTLEVRVPDAQPTVRDAGAVIALVHCLVAWLVARHDAGDALPSDARWEIEEDRWLAARHGVEGPLRSRVDGLLSSLAPVAAQLGCEDELAGVDALVADPWPARLRAAGDARSAAALLVDAFAEG